MAKSKFLPYQDRDNDGLVDACKDIPLVESPINCPSCKPNPNAFTPNWRKRTIFEPFLNQKLCKYQITVRTEEDTTRTIDDNKATTVMQGLFEEYSLHIHQFVQEHSPFHSMFFLGYRLFQYEIKAHENA